MKDKVGREFDAFVTGVAAFGVFVTLKDFFVEGLVPISALGEDFFVYEGEAASPAGPLERKGLPPGRLPSGEAHGDRRGAPPPGLPPRGSELAARRVLLRPPAAEGRSMNRRIRAGAVLGVGVALLAAGGCREKGRPDPNIQMAVSHEPDAAAASETTGAGGGGVGGNGGQGTRIPSRLEIPRSGREGLLGNRSPLEGLDDRQGREARSAARRVRLRGGARLRR
jgi:hypothetical protein